VKKAFLSDEHWSKIEPLLLKLRISGPPWAGNRRVLEEVPWVLKTGARWPFTHPKSALNVPAILENIAPVQHEISNPARSPLSNRKPEHIRPLAKAFLLEQLELYYGAKPPPEIVDCDYSLWQCAETDLQFCWPMHPGSAAFYEWVSQFDSYYPGVRWEYREVRRHVEKEQSSNGQAFKVLDAGCGKGDFLRLLNTIPAGSKFALDLNQPAVEACRQQGFQAFCGTVETAMDGGFLPPSSFSAVTSFHCLEHVPNPVEFVQALLKTVAPGGRVFVSTPYSPMSFERDYFDIMNHPPHHMTRWNLKAYQRLAEMVGAKMRYFAPPSYPAHKALNVFRLKQYGPNRPAGKATLAKDVLAHLPSFLRSYQYQKERARASGVGASDVILVEFTLA
jgi:SAM-dependent methyltransferase